MNLAKIQVSGVRAVAVDAVREIPAGIVGATVELEYTGGIWAGLNKTVIFRGNTTKEVLTDETTVTVPAEVVAEPRGRLRVGVYGTDAANNLIMPTLWAELGVIADSAEPSEPEDSTLPIWAQLYAMIGNLGNLDTEAKSSLVAAVNELVGKSGSADPEAIKEIVEDYLAANPPKGEKGDKGDPGDDYVLTEADKAEIAEQAAELVDVPEGGGTGGTSDYTELTNKPKINGVELTGNKSLDELGIGAPTDEQVGTAVKEYLDEHPEATTTVADGSITPAKTDFLELVSAEAITPTLTSDGYWAYRTDYIDVSGGRSLYVTVTGLIDSDPRDIYLEGSDSNKSAVLSKTGLDGKEISRIKYESDGTRTLMYSIDVPKYGEFSYVRLWIGQIKNTDTAYTVRAYYSKEAASAVADFVRPSQKYDVRLADGSISLKQTDFAGYVNPTIMDYTNAQMTGYNTDEHLNQFGAAHAQYFADYLEVNENHELYFRAANSNYSTAFIRKVVCYDADKNTLPDETYTDVVVRKVGGSSLDGSKIPLDDGREAPVVSTHKITVSENVKYIRWMGTYIAFYDFIIVSQEDIVNLTAVPEKYALSVSDDFKKIVQTCVKGNKEYSGVFIGDSLTNWGGGGVGSGFLGIVHEKTGMSPMNEGLAGATWQTSSGQTACAVQRVDKIIADGRKYDLYCFLMGTNGGANTDTGETSADTSTMPGAIRYCMEKLKAYDPTAKILVCLPPQRAEGNENQEKVNEVIKKIAESYSVKTLDVYHHSGIVPNTVVANSNYLSDGLHLGENGITALGNLLASEIKYLFCL